MPKFEYMTLPVTPEDGGMFAYTQDSDWHPLNKLGEQNWELLNVTQDETGQDWGYFKRKHPSAISADGMT